jgi:hypothetical protein
MSQLVASLVQRSTYQSILRAVRLTAVSHTLALIRGSTRRTFRHLTERRVNHYALAFDRARGVGPRCQANGDPLSDSSADAGGQISDFGVATHAETLRMVNSYTVLRSIERARISPRRERFRMNQPIPSSRHGESMQTSSGNVHHAPLPVRSARNANNFSQFFHRVGISRR